VAMEARLMAISKVMTMKSKLTTSP
jgi:hypothetical protein